MTYPATIDEFPTHQDFIDDVEANDVNNIQDSITDIELTLGINPQIFHDQQTIVRQQGDPLFNQATRDQQARVVKYASVADRLDALERGGAGGQGGNGGLPWFHLNATQVAMPSTDGALSDEPPILPVSPPFPNSDRFQMFNGRGVTLRKDGFWLFNAFMIVQMLGVPDDNFGVYELTVAADTDYRSGANRTEHSITSQGIVIVQTQLMMLLNGGTKVTLRAQQNSNITQTIQKVSISGVQLRDTSTLG